jgi:molecular chaperone DnaK (HSP70)
VRAEDLATGVEKSVKIEATDSRLNESDKNRMIREARDRVTKMLAERIKETRSDEARNIISRAESVMALAVSHPLESDLRNKTEELRNAVEVGDEDALNDLIDDVLRVMTEIEAGA